MDVVSGKRGTFSCCLTKGFTMNLFKKLLLAGFLAVSMQSVVCAASEGQDALGAKMDLENIIRLADSIDSDSSHPAKKHVSAWLTSFVGIDYWVLAKVQALDASLDEKVELLSRMIFIKEQDAEKEKWQSLIRDAKRHFLVTAPSIMAYLAMISFLRK